MTDEKFPDKEVEVKLDPFTDLLQTTIKANDAVWKAGYAVGHDEGHNAGYDEGHSVGYDQGYKAGWKAGSLTSTEERSINEQDSDH